MPGRGPLRASQSPSISYPESGGRASLSVYSPSRADCPSPGDSVQSQGFASQVSLVAGLHSSLSELPREPGNPAADSASLPCLPTLQSPKGCGEGLGLGCEPGWGLLH